MSVINYDYTMINYDYYKIILNYEALESESTIDREPKEIRIKRYEELNNLASYVSYPKKYHALIHREDC